jgi:hypothetical protein
MVVFQILVWAGALGLGGWVVYRSRKAGIPVLVLLIAVAGVGTWALGLLQGPSEVPGKVFQADRIIYNYDWFFAKRATILSYEGQIANTASAVEEFRKDHAGDLGSYVNSTELSRLQSILLSLRNQMAKDVQEYNAQAMNLTRGSFKDWRLPSSFTISGDVGVESYE